MSISTIMEILALLSALLWCRQESNLFKWFIPFLLYTVVNEMIAYYVGFELHIRNYVFYIIYIPIAFAFYSYILLHEINDQKQRIAGVFLAVSGVGFSIVNMLWIQGFALFNTYTNTLLSVLLIVICMLFLYDYLKRSHIVHNPLREPLFWLIAGLLFFYFGGLIVNLLYTYSVQQDFKINGKKMYSFIIDFLNVLLYGCLIIAFRLCYKNKKSIF